MGVCDGMNDKESERERKQIYTYNSEQKKYPRQ